MSEDPLELTEDQRAIKELYERVKELEKTIEKHKKDIFNLKGNEQAHDFMFENKEKLVELETRMDFCYNSALPVRDNRITELEQKLENCITFPELEGNIEAFSERVYTIKAVLKDVLIILEDEYFYSSKQLLKKLEGEPDWEPNFDVVYKPLYMKGEQDANSIGELWDRIDARAAEPTEDEKEAIFHFELEAFNKKINELIAEFLQRLTDLYKYVDIDNSLQWRYIRLLIDKYEIGRGNDEVLY